MISYTQGKPHSFVLPSWQYILLILSLLVSIALVVISWLAYWVEDEQMALYGLFVWLTLAAAAGYWLYHFPHRINRYSDCVHFIWMGRRKDIPIQAIENVKHRRYQLCLVTKNQQYRCTFLSPNDAASLLTWLENEIPALQARQESQVPTTLPLTLTPRLTAPLITAIMTIIFGITGGAIGWMGWSVWQRGDGMTDLLGLALMGAMSLFCTAIFLHILIGTYVWRITFDEDQIKFRYALRSETYAASDVVGMKLVTEERTVKGFVHQIYILRLLLMDDTTLDIAPNLPSFPMDYAGAEEVRLLAQVQQILEKHYNPVMRVEVETTAFAHERWGRPALAIQWQIRPYALTVTRLDYGEHHAAASTIHFLVGHSEAGAIRFRTTNGESAVSADGRYILLYDERLLVVFNLANGRTYHRNSRSGWLYAQAKITDGTLEIEEMRRTDVHKRAHRNPIDLMNPTSALRRGFGSAENGDFPSAYG